MELPPNHKPSLEDLFNSKKLDKPSDEFWNDFQEKFRNKALTSIVRNDSIFSTSLKLGLSFTFLFLFSVFGALFYYLNQDVSHFVSINSEDDLLVNKISNLSESQITDRDTSLNGSEFFMNEQFKKFDQEIYVENKYLVSSLESKFQHRVLDSSFEFNENQVLSFSF
jgi:hypothetical protein